MEQHKIFLHLTVILTSVFYGIKGQRNFTTKAFTPTPVTIYSTTSTDGFKFSSTPVNTMIATLNGTDRRTLPTFPTLPVTPGPNNRTTLFPITPSSPLTSTDGRTIPFPTQDYCLNETVGSAEAYGIFTWPDTAVGDTSSLPCPYNKENSASRECRYSNETTRAIWGQTDVQNCTYIDRRSKNLFKLAQKEVNESNVVEIAQEIKNLSLIPQGQTLPPGDIDNIATILGKIVAVKEKANEISEDFLTTIDNVLDARTEDIKKSQQTRNSSSRILEALDNFADAFVIGAGNTFEKVKRNYAINLLAVQSQSFTGLTFSGNVKNSDQSGLKNNSISTRFNDSIPSTSSASLIIPETIFNESNIPQASGQQTVVFSLYKETKFFLVSSSRPLNSLVISGRIKGLSIENLSEPVEIILQSISRGDTNTTQCSFWDFSIGNWSQEGCRFVRVLKDGRVVCNCDHLTNFAMLMDHNPTVPEKHERVLGIISYVGCALSLTGLVLTIVTILILKDLRSKTPSQILLNVCIALSLTLIVFLAAAERSKTSSLAGCRAAAIALHYFLLSAFFWMAGEALNMYMAFVKVFPQSSSSKFMLKCYLFAWGLPVIIVGITMIAAFDMYGDHKYCRLHGVPFIVAFLVPVSLIIFGNIVMFCFIIRSLLTSGRVTSIKKVSGIQQARRALGITMLLGLTWIFGVLAINDAKLAFQYLFCIFNTLQGLFIFIFFCVLPVGTREKLHNLFRTKTTTPANQESSHQNSKDKNIEFNNLTYSDNTSTIPKTFEFEVSTTDGNAVPVTPLTSNDDAQPEHKNLETDAKVPELDTRSHDVIFSNPDVTRYSVRKQGTNYITTIEINVNS